MNQTQVRARYSVSYRRRLTVTQEEVVLIGLFGLFWFGEFRQLYLVARIQT